MFCNLLRRASRHLTREKLKLLTQIAVEDHRYCYKQLIEIIKREARIVRERKLLNLLYILSDVLLTTHRLLGAYNRLSIRFLDDAESVLAPFTSCPMVKIFKVLGWWAQKEIFPSEEFRRVRKILLDDIPKTTNKRQRKKHEAYEQTPTVKRQCKDYCLSSNSCKTSLSLEEASSPIAQCNCIGPFGVPYDRTWRFGEGRDGYEARLKSEASQSGSEVDWISICNQIATSKTMCNKNWII